MRRKKSISRWSRSNSKQAAAEATEPAAAKVVERSGSGGSGGGFGGTSMTDDIDYGSYYDKINARGKCDDLVLLENVSNQGIVETLRNRYLAGDMYTSIGPVLIAVNPYKQLSKGGKGIYTSGVADYYQRKGGGDFMAPHIYRIASEAYKNLCKDAVDQCVIVTGESGAGKTEAAKQLMQFVTTVGTSNHEQKVTMEGVQKHLLESNPILEAFGNAQTIRNDNSSRFGKYMELQFTYKGAIRGGKVTNYLLEKSRVTGQAHGERCFHVMHYLLHGASDKEKEDFCLLSPSDYVYLMEQDKNIPGVNDGQEFDNLKYSMSAVGIDETDQFHAFSLLGGVLATGNVSFNDHGDGKRATVIRSPSVYDDDGGDALSRVSKCLGVDAEALESALTCVTLVVGRRHSTEGKASSGGDPSRRVFPSSRRNSSSWISDSYGSGQFDNHERYLNGGDAAKSRDALAKELYKRLFSWIVDKVNRSIECTSDGLTMGILDIYGFEIFDSNGFEQFCINYVNEKLQQYFIDHTIRAEQDDYETEGVEWEHVDYFNNKTVCDMIEGRHGLLSLLDEVSSYKDNDGAVLVNRYNRAMANHDHYLPGQEAVYGTGYARRKNALDRKMTMSKDVGIEGTRPLTTRVAEGRGDKQFCDANKIFGVRHFAGNVTYKAEHFIEKNADKLHRDVVSLIAKSSNPLARMLFQPAESDEIETRRHPSLSAQFKKQVEALCTSLARCRPHYVRCIKPNSRKAPLEMDEDMTTHQVKYLGLQENVRVRRQGYAFRMPLEYFVRRYGFMSETTWPNRVLRKFWPDGTPYSPAHPLPPAHLITYDEIVEEFEEQQEVTDSNFTCSQSNVTTDSSEDGVTDKEARTPTHVRPATPPRTLSKSIPFPIGTSQIGRTLSGSTLRSFTPARLMLRTPSRNNVRSSRATPPKPVKAVPATDVETLPKMEEDKHFVTVISKRIRKVERKVNTVERSTWTPAKLGPRQAIAALLEEGRAKRWDPRLTGGKRLHLSLHQLKADSGAIKLGKTKIFIKNPHTLFDLEDQRTAALFPVAVMLQSKFRAYTCRRRYLHFLAIFRRVGALVRGFLARIRYRRMVKGVPLVQARFRGRAARMRYARLKVAAKGHPLRFYALKIQRTWRGYECRNRIPPRILKRARLLGPKLVVHSQRMKAADAFQSLWRMYLIRKAFLRCKQQMEVIQAIWRRHLAARQFRRLRNADADRTLNDLKGGVTLVKHTVGSSFRMSKSRVARFVLSPDGRVLRWDGAGGRGEQGVNIVADVSKITKGITSKTLRKMGNKNKGEFVWIDGRRFLGEGNYLVLHQTNGKTLNLECAHCSERESIYRAFARRRGEW